jgi:murein DD-endopeptidase MepM/ murein hydrolase activator NlpD
LHLPKATRRRIVYTVATVVVCGSTILTWEHFAQPAKPSAAATTPYAASVHPELNADEQSVSQDAAKKTPAAANAEKLEKKQLKPSEKESAYTVVEGDTISAIAAKYGLQSESILMTNNLSETDTLSIGQELQIPAVDGTVYEVASGDTLWDLAQAYGVTHDDIVNANPDIDPDNLKLGQKLLLPGAKEPVRNVVASRGTSGRPAGHKLTWPAVGIITDYFGWRIHPVFGTENYHDGIDIGVGMGTPVGAAANGKVIYTGYYGGYGKTVKVDHGGGLVTWYCHLSSIEVSVGDQVKTGGLVAYSGNTGDSTGPHLHFTVLVDGSPVDPLTWLP